MDVKETARKQYQAIVDRTASAIGRQSPMPSEGWISLTRKALGMSAAQLARRLGLTRARISQAEQSEIGGGVTLKTMHSLAEGMGCRFVYAIVPAEGRIDDVIAAQAHKKAKALVEKASTHMALEKQSLSGEKNREEIERIADQLVRTMPSDLWNDK